MGLANGLLVASVMHKRLHPKMHSLRYTVYYLCFPLHHLAALKTRLLSINRFNLFSFREKDYGDQRGDVNGWVYDVLSDYAIEIEAGSIELLTMPRLFGYAFNPVSFWFCKDKTGILRAVIAEVHNTFGERHCYFCAHPDRRPITQDDWLVSEKAFHVSPFLEVKGEYHFRFAYGQERIGVWIDYYDQGQKILATSLIGTRRTLNDPNLTLCFFRYPLVTFAVILRIHTHALRLVLKGIRYRVKPPPPTKDIT